MMGVMTELDDSKRLAIVSAYALGMEVDQLCNDFGISRTVLAELLKTTGIRRSAICAAPNVHVATLYDALRVATEENERLKQEEAQLMDELGRLADITEQLLELLDSTFGVEVSPSTPDDDPSVN